MKNSEQLPPQQPEDQQFWKQHVESFRTSELNRAAYCRLHNLTYHRFAYWLRKLQSESSQLVAIKLKSIEQEYNLPVLCSINLNANHKLHIHDLKMVDYLLGRFIA